MFFIAGTSGETTTAGTGEFHCPECDTQMPYHHEQVHQTATVFFISIANLKLLGEYVECQGCASTYEMEILEYDPELEQRRAKAIYVSGAKTVMATMMLANGKVDETERSMMKSIHLEIVGSELSGDELDDEIQSCRENPMDLDECLNGMFAVLNESGRESIIKIAYWVSIADGEVDKKEVKLLAKLAKHFQMSNAHLKGILSEVDELAAS